MFIKTVSTTIPHPHIAIQSLGQNPNSPDHTPTADGGPGAVLVGPTIATFADGNTLNAHGCDRIRRVYNGEGIGQWRQHGISERTFYRWKAQPGLSLFAAAAVTLR